MDFLYLQFLQLLPLGSEIMKSAAALLHYQLCGVQLLLKRRGVRLKVLHLRQKVLAQNNHHEAFLTGQHQTAVLLNIQTCRPASLLWRLDMKLFQSSLATLLLARTASLVSLAATANSRSALTSTVFSLDSPVSLWLRKS